MPDFLHNGLRLEYTVRGEGVPFVFLHGMGGSIMQIESSYDPIPGVKLISLNQQGHGNSEVDWTHYDFDHLADDALALLDWLNISEAHLAGISMGAAVGLNLAARYPERVQKILLIRNAWTDRPMSRNVQTAYRDLGLSLKLGSIEAFYKTEGWQIVKDTTPYTRNAFTCAFGDPVCLRCWQKYLILPKLTPVASTDVLKAVAMPVSILANRNDLCHPFQYGAYLQERLPDSVLLEIPDKDTDPDGHRAFVNRAIHRMFFMK